MLMCVSARPRQTSICQNQISELRLWSQLPMRDIWTFVRFWCLADLLRYKGSFKEIEQRIRKQKRGQANNSLLICWCLLQDLLTMKCHTNSWSTRMTVEGTFLIGTASPPYNVCLVSRINKSAEISAEVHDGTRRTALHAAALMGYASVVQSLGYWCDLM